MIDLTDLNIPQVVIIVQQGDIHITSSKQDVMQDVRGLPCPIKVLNNGPNTEIICCDGIDYLALAEKLATTWEARDHRVQRVYTSSCARNRKPIDSFELVNKFMTRYRIYRLSPGQGFYVVFEGKRAYSFSEQVPVDEAVNACLTVLEDESANCWKTFIEDFNTFGIEGFGWYNSTSI